MRALRLACLLLAAFCAAGCTPIYWNRVTLNQKLRASDIDFITAGQTRWTDVVARLGAPSDLTPTASGFVASYIYYDAADFYADFGYPLGFISPLASQLPHRLALGTTGVGADQLRIGVGDDGRVQFTAFTNGERAGRFTALPLGN